MSDARAMARRMSYRKPVPIYIPSPPTSPHSPSKELDGQHVVVEEEIPPLPDNWREIISTKIKEVNSSKLSLYAGQKVPNPATKETYPSNPMDGHDEDQGSLSLLSTANKSAAFRRYSMRGLPTQYRPPTPPLRSPKVQEPLSETLIESEDITSLSMSQCGSPRPSLAPHLPAATSTPSLNLSPSFMSDRTIISQNTEPIMAPWSQSLGTLANGWPANCTTSPGKQMADVWSLPESPDEDRTFCWSYTSCTFFTGIVVQLKNMRG